MNEETKEVQSHNKLKIDHEKMALGYLQMSDVNLEEAEAAKYTYNDGLEGLQ